MVKSCHLVGCFVDYWIPCGYCDLLVIGYPVGIVSAVIISVSWALILKYLFS